MNSDVIRLILMRAFCSDVGSCNECCKLLNCEECSLEEMKKKVNTEEEFNLAKLLLEQVDQLDKDNTHEWTEDEIMSLFGIG